MAKMTVTIAQPELCPFCGDMPELRIEVRDDYIHPPRPHWHAKVECDCGASTNWDKVSEQEAKEPVNSRINLVVTAWNTRASSSGNPDMLRGQDQTLRVLYEALIQKAVRGGGLEDHLPDDLLRRKKVVVLMDLLARDLQRCNEQDEPIAKEKDAG